MRLVTYDRRGARRLGALVEDIVVDLPDAVGHPSFPSTMEALVARNGGTTFDAARAALARPGVMKESRVRRPRLLTPYLPPFRRERILGPGEEVPWPPDAPFLDHNPQLGCVVGRAGRRATATKASGLIFGYMLVVTWSPIRRLGGGRSRVTALSFGPCIVTDDEFDPGEGMLVARIDGKPSAQVPLAAARSIFAHMLSVRSMTEKGARPGMVLASPLRRRGGGLGIPLEPGAEVRVEGPGLGVLDAVLGEAPSQEWPVQASASPSAQP